MQTLDQSKLRATVSVVDDDHGFRGGIVRLLDAAGFHVTGYASADEFLLAQCSWTPHCILLDVSMPGMNGIDLLAALALRRRQVPVIFLTGSTDVSTSVHAMKGGALDFLSKPIESDKLLATVRRAIAIDEVRCASADRARPIRHRYETLTERERYVMAGVAQGKLNKQLAAELDSCERTVKDHRAKVMAKLEVESVAELVRTAVLLGLALAGQGKDVRGNIARSDSMLYGGRVPLAHR